MLLLFVLDQIGNCLIYWLGECCSVMPFLMTIKPSLICLLPNVQQHTLAQVWGNSFSLLLTKFFGLVQICIVPSITHIKFCALTGTAIVMTCGTLVVSWACMSARNLFLPFLASGPSLFFVQDMRAKQLGMSHLAIIDSVEPQGEQPECSTGSTFTCTYAPPITDTTWLCWK